MTQEETPGTRGPLTLGTDVESIDEIHDGENVALMGELIYKLMHERDEARAGLRDNPRSPTDAEVEAAVSAIRAHPVGSLSDGLGDHWYRDLARAALLAAFAVREET